MSSLVHWYHLRRRGLFRMRFAAQHACMICFLKMCFSLRKVLILILALSLFSEFYFFICDRGGVLTCVLDFSRT